MLQFCYDEKNGCALTIADELPSPGCCLEQFQHLAGGNLVPDVEQPDVRLMSSDSSTLRVAYGERSGTYRCYTSVPDSERARVQLWRYALLRAIQAHVLRDMPVALMHGCLLQDDDGMGILLCGQSGMGKSTTARRWKEAGGQAPADDMILLYTGGDKLIAHPLPTWSRCLETLEGEAYHFDKGLVLKSILTLNRDPDKEEIREVPGYAYLTAIYASCALFNLNLVRKSSSAQAEKLISSIKKTAQMLYDTWPHRTLFANLEGNLKESIRQGNI